MPNIILDVALFYFLFEIWCNFIKFVGLVDVSG